MKINRQKQIEFIFGFPVAFLFLGIFYGALVIISKGWIASFIIFIIFAVLYFLVYKWFFKEVMKLR